MRKIILFFAVIVMTATALKAYTTNSTELLYRRNSVYSILVNHTDDKFSKEIFSEFTKIPVPEKFNDHNLSVVGLGVTGKYNHTADIDKFVKNNRIASRLVAKWFNRDMSTGVCDMELVKARGLYNATEFDKEFASHTARGASLLADAGEDLIANTYLLVNEVTYVDKNEGAKVAAKVLVGFGAVLGAVLGAVAVANGGSSDSIAAGAALGLAAGAATGAVVQTLKGFSVKIVTSLYQLDWNEEIAGLFYSQHYTETPDEVKRANFERDRDKFTLKYLGQVTSKGSETSFLGINENEPELMIRKACQRAIDENVVDLQHSFEQFRVKSPIMSVAPYLTIPIGKKEGVTKESKYEVLEAREEGDRIKYVRVGTIAPVEGKIWDNRFMAVEEHAEGATLGMTTFKKVSGKDLLPGMLVREMI